MKRDHFLICFLIAVCLAALAPCALAEGVLRMATTTSTQNSGLLEHLLPPFEAQSGLRIHVIAVGTGKALRMGDAGDVDLVLVHAPAAELAYVRKGAFVMRRTLMHNFFVLLGPPQDPVGVERTTAINIALGRIAAAKSRFVSRGDKSGTHTKEMALWKAAGITPGGSWYQEVGQGMGRALIIANERQAYVLSDDATFFAFKARLNLQILSRREPLLRNVYSAMAVNPAVHPHVRFKEATRLINWLAAKEGQRLIAEYRRNGRRLFTPVLEPPR